MLIMLLDGPGEMTWEADSYAVLFSVLVKTEERIFGNVLLLPFIHRENESQPCAKPRLKHKWASWMNSKAGP